MKIKILYEDASLVLCVKPAGVVSEDSGMPRLLREFCGEREIFCVHRLDRDAAGLMVYAKTRQAAADLSAEIASRSFEKSYLAAVEGEPEPEGCLRDLLFHDASKNKSYVVKRMRRGVREAELRYEPLQRTTGLSLVRVHLLTGRSHQIRVQFSSRGMPLVGDGRYGSALRGCPLALWSERLCFAHPAHGEELCFSAAPPACFPWTEFSLT